MTDHSSSPPGAARANRLEAPSRHVHRFNHDEDAAGYDQDVRRESDPIRAGYDRLLAWVAAQVHDLPEGPILELGSGTGNLTRRLPTRLHVVAVDISREMTRRLLAKMPTERAEIQVEIDDVLAFARRSSPATYGAVVSTYTLHHLEGDEKQSLFAELRRILKPGGRFVVGDLMFENAQVRRACILREREAGNNELADDMEDEFFWELDRDVAALRDAGFMVSVPVTFSELSWGLIADLR